VYRGRFAPSPTGDLHLGSAACALVAWLSARASGGAFVLRVEDLDTPRCRPGVEARQLADLRWLGLEWDEGPDGSGARGPYRQSERRALYDSALHSLEARGLVYLCDCSRAEIAHAASAPHTGEEGPRYPGICRRFGMLSRDWKRAPAVRLAVPDRLVTVEDALQGRVSENVGSSVGDFVLRRGDGVYAYQLAVVVDDLAMGITEVVRGADLLASVARQALLGALLGGAVPAYAHHALLLGPDGERLAKRNDAVTIAALRARGVTAGAVVSAIARSLGLTVPPGEVLSPGTLVAGFDRSPLVGRKTALAPALLPP
jgi:glutamyl-tRNA synthetase